MFGGIGSYTYYLGQGFVINGHSVTVLTSYINNPRNFTSKGIHVFQIGPYASLEAFRCSVWKYFGDIGRTAFDVVESPDWGADGAMLSSDILGAVPHIVTCHTPSWYMYRLFREERTSWSEFKMAMRPWKWPKWQFKEEVTLVKRASAVHSPSKAMLKVVEEYLGPLKKKDIIPNPCMPLNGMSIVNENRDNNNPLVLFVGKLNIVKGADLLASIIPIIADAIPNSRFWLIGADGRAPAGSGFISMKQFLLFHLRKLKDRITISDRVPLDQVRVAYDQSSVSIFPSRWESWGMVAVEAMSAGSAVVGTCNGGMAELIQAPKFGLIADPANPEVFAGEVIRILNDGELRAIIINSAFQMLKKELSPEHIASKKIDAYRRAGARG